jgi:hypothetical protein
LSISIFTLCPNIWIFEHDQNLPRRTTYFRHVWHFFTLFWFWKSGQIKNKKWRRLIHLRNLRPIQFWPRFYILKQLWKNDQKVKGLAFNCFQLKLRSSPKTLTFWPFLDTFCFCKSGPTSYSHIIWPCLSWDHFSIFGNSG